MPVGDARVDHRDADAGARVTVLELHGARADGHRDAVHLAPGRPVVMDALDEREVGQPADDGVRQIRPRAR